MFGLVVRGSHHGVHCTVWTHDTASFADTATVMLDHGVPDTGVEVKLRG
jgi:hypothetical protein